MSNVVDLAKWDAALAARKLLKPASYDAMWTPMRLNDGKPSSYALGWQVEPYRTRPRQSHGGGISGFSTFVARFPDDKVTVIALVNQAGGAGSALVNGIAEIYVPALKDAPPKPIADPDREDHRLPQGGHHAGRQGRNQSRMADPGVPDRSCCRTASSRARR